MRSGKPCPARERRASSAPACRIAARSWSLRGCRAVSPGVLVPSARPAAGVRASRADARAGPGTGPPPGRSLTRTAPGPAHTPASPAGPDRAARGGVPPPVPVKPGARPAGHARQSGDVRPALGGLAGRQPWRGACCFPRVRSSRGTGRPAAGRGRMRPVRPVDDAAGSFTGPGPVMGRARGSSGAGLAGQAGACPVRPAWLLPGAQDPHLDGVHDADEEPGISGGVVGKVPVNMGKVPDSRQISGGDCCLRAGGSRKRRGRLSRPGP